MNRKLIMILAAVAVISVILAGTGIVLSRPQKSLAAEPEADGYYHYDLPPRPDGLLQTPETAANFPPLLSQLGATQLSDLSIQIGIPAPDANGLFTDDAISQMPVTISGPKGQRQVVVDRSSSDLEVATAEGKQIIVGEVTGYNGDTVGIVAFPGGTADFRVVVNGVFLAFGNLVITDEIRKLVVPEEYLH